MKFTCAQRGCEFEAKTRPESCAVCNNPFIDAAQDNTGGEVPWSDYSVPELREYCESWGIEIGSRESKTTLITLLTAAEAE